MFLNLSRSGLPAAFDDLLLGGEIRGVESPARGEMVPRRVPDLADFAVDRHWQGADHHGPRCQHPKVADLTYPISILDAGGWCPARTPLLQTKARGDEVASPVGARSAGFARYLRRATNALQVALRSTDRAIAAGCGEREVMGVRTGASLA